MMAADPRKQRMAAGKRIIDALLKSGIMADADMPCDIALDLLGVFHKLALMRYGLDGEEK